MPTPSSSIRRPLIVATALVLAALFIVFIPARADDENDPVVLKKRISLLEDKIAALEEQVARLQAQQKSGGSAALTGDEIEKFKLVMDALSPADREQAEAELNKMSDAQRIQAIRQLTSMTPGQLERAKKRSQATRTLEDLRLLDSATDQYAIEMNKITGMHPSFGDLKNYLKTGTTLYNTGADVFGHVYGPFTVDSIPLVPAQTFNALSDVADDSFWTPYK